MNRKEKISDWIAHAERDLNLSANVYCQIASAPKDEQSELLEHFLKEVKKHKSDKSQSLPKYISGDALERLRAEFEEKGDAFFLQLRQQNPSVPEFYRKLWEYISSAPELPSNEARVFALHNMAVDSRIPYQQMGWDKLVSMENDRFQKINSALESKGVTDKLEYILEYPLDQKTERAGLVINLLDALPSIELKAVLLARVISFFERRAMSAIFSGPDDD